MNNFAIIKLSSTKLLGALLLAAGLVSVSIVSLQANAFDLGKALEDAAKKEIEKAKNGGEEAVVAPAPVATPASPIVVPAPTDAQAPAASPVVAEPAPPAQPEFNWRNPSKEEEIALGREITGSLLGAAPLVKDEALQKYVNQVGRWVANPSDRAD